MEFLKTNDDSDRLTIWVKFSVAPEFSNDRDEIRVYKQLSRLAVLSLNGEYLPKDENSDEIILSFAFSDKDKFSAALDVLKLAAVSEIPTYGFFTGFEIS